MNNRDAFSHSEQCDRFFSIISLQIGGVEHSGCRCWCHNAQHLFATPEPEYDLTPPPEYLSSADRAFVLDEPAHVRVGFSLATPDSLEHVARVSATQLTGHSEPESVATAMSRSQLYDPGNVTAPDRPFSVDIHEGPANKAGFSKWSRKELTSGKCETCGDKLADCECVE